VKTAAFVQASRRQMTKQRIRNFVAAMSRSRGRLRLSSEPSAKPGEMIMESVALAPTHTALKNTGAVFAGLVAVAGLSHVTDAALHASGVFTEYGATLGDALFLLALAYRSLFGVFGGYLAARIGGGRQATLLGVIGTVLGLLGLAASCKHPELGPIWYPIALVVVALPSARLGAELTSHRR
jgi:hypothetical protein